MSQSLNQNLERLQTLRDEIRVRIHLAKLDAKDAWTELETQLPDFEKAAEDTSNAAARAVVDGAIKRLEALRAAIR